MSKMKPEKSRIKSDILLRVRLLYILFILAGLLIFARLVWVQLFSSEVAYNAERLAGRIFTEQIIPAQRGNILTRDGDPLATSIFRYRVEFDFGSPGLDSVRTFHEQSDSLSKLLAAYFGDRSAAEYRRMFRTQHAKHYQVKYRKDTLVPRSEGRIARWIDRILDREFVPKKLYDTLRDHTPVQIFPRDIDYTEWETLRKYPLLNWNMGMVYNLRESDERIYPQGELGRRTIGLTGDRGNYGIEAVYREELAGRDGRATRQRIARGFYGRVVDGDNIDPIDGLDVVTTLDLDVQDVANRYLREQLEAQNAIWGTTIVMEVESRGQFEASGIQVFVNGEPDFASDAWVYKTGNVKLTQEHKDILMTGTFDNLTFSHAENAFRIRYSDGSGHRWLTKDGAACGEEDVIFSTESKTPLSKEWNCPNCETRNEGKFCTNCGIRQPFCCKSCGRQPTNEKIPVYCPECGSRLK